MYRPPATNSAGSINLCNFLRNQLDTVRNYAIFGNFNFPGRNWSENSASTLVENYFMDLLNEIGAHQMILEATTQYHSTLDLCLVSNDELIENLQICELFSTSDHCIISCCIRIPENCPKKKKTVHKFQNVDWELVHAHLAVIDWPSLFHGCFSVDEMWTEFKTSINHLTDLYVPTQTTKSISTPWFNRKLGNMKKTKQKMGKI